MDQARNQTCLLYNFINTLSQMTYIFYHLNKWFLHPGDLPGKPLGKEFAMCPEHLDAIDEYNNAIADIKAKALEIAKPEKIISAVKGHHLDFKGEFQKGEFYQWPGTFEVKRLIDYQTPAFAHLVLPPEEKNIDEMYYLNGTDEFIPNEEEDPWMKLKNPRTKLT